MHDDIDNAQRSGSDADISPLPNHILTYLNELTLSAKLKPKITAIIFLLQFNMLAFDLFARGLGNYRKKCLRAFDHSREVVH